MDAKVFAREVRDHAAQQFANRVLAKVMRDETDMDLVAGATCILRQKRIGRRLVESGDLAQQVTIFKALIRKIEQWLAEIADQVECHACVEQLGDILFEPSS